MATRPTILKFITVLLEIALTVDLDYILAPRILERVTVRTNSLLDVSLAHDCFDDCGRADCVRPSSSCLEGILLTPTRIRRGISRRSRSVHGQLQDSARSFRARAYLFGERR